MSSLPLLGTDAELGNAEHRCCRVCHCDAENEENGILLSPCLCDGSVRWVHQSCLNTWRFRGARSVKRASHCELCKCLYQYDLQRLSRFEAICELVRHIVFSRTVLTMVVCAYVSTLAKSLQVTAFVLGIVIGLFGIIDLFLALFPPVLAKQARIKISFGKSSMDLAVQRFLVAGMGDSEIEKGHAAALAQADAVIQAQATAQSFSDFEDGIQVDAAAAAAAAATGLAIGGDDGDQAAPIQQLCCSASCCFECLCFLATPPIIYFVWWSASHILGGKNLKALSVGVAIFGLFYWSIIFVINLLGILRRPPLQARVGPDGLPVVRSLTAKERETDLLARPT